MKQKGLTIEGCNTSIGESTNRRKGQIEGHHASVDWKEWIESSSGKDHRVTLGQ